MEQVVHHIEMWIAKDGDEFVKRFCSKYQFNISAHRHTSYYQQSLVTDDRQQLRFLISYATPDLKREGEGNNFINNAKQDLMKNDPYVTCPTIYDSSKKYQSSVFNVALNVKHIKRRVNHLQKCGVTFVQPLQTISDDHGSVTLATARSCIGNVVHTLVDRQGYQGTFLPGFVGNNKETKEEKTQKSADKKHTFSSFFTNFDHVTFAVPTGTSTSVLQWYEQCFDMKRFNVNSGEDEAEGFVIDLPGIALRLKAFEYWKCAEVGLCSKSANGLTNILFVIAESLPGSASNQVDTFLKEHGGPGIQHIGMLTNTIIDTVDRLKDQGVKFVEPPYTYYKEIEPLMKLCKLGNYLKSLQNLGILIDVENKGDEEPRYLMQKFTKPLFEENTFFLEVIQRNGAKGFGSANIAALWKSLQMMLDEKSQQLQQAEISK